RNIEFASSMNIQGTPSLIFEDGSMVPGAVGVSELERLLNSSQKSK
ncbi:protein-disulfide isomerase, partial [Acinetobacter baumannii]